VNIAVLVVGSVFAGLAALIHLYIWLLESVLWTRPSTQRTFGVRSASDAETLRPMAYNQGFYNLFLALGVAVGLVLLWSGLQFAGLLLAGLVLTLFACASMMLAALVLVTSNRRMLRAALVQGAAPLVAVVALIVVLATG
jgi:putative membrane protein